MRENPKFKNVIILLVLLGIFGIALNALALEIDWPPSPSGEVTLDDDTSLAEMVKYFYEWIIAIAGLAVFFILVMAGFQYLTSVGDPGKMKDATDRIKSAIFGLVLLLSSYLILNLINPELTTLKMPVVETPTDTLEGIGELDPPDFSEPCEKVYVYSQPNYSTKVETIFRGADKNIWVSKESGSIEFIYIKNGEEKRGGICRVELYQQTGCDGDPMYTLHSSYQNIKPFYLDYDIQCISVEEF